MEIKKINPGKELAQALTLFQNEYGSEVYKTLGVELYKHFVLTNPDKDYIVVKGFVEDTFSGYAAYEKGEMIGMVIYTCPNYVRKLAVKRGYTNKGIGSALLRKVEENTPSNEVVVHAFFSAEEFYLKNGFQKTGPLNDEVFPYWPMKKIVK